MSTSPNPAQPLATIQNLSAFSDHLAARREAILKAWRSMAGADPEQMTGRTLTTGQFLDHIPQILDAFEARLRSRQGGIEARAAEIDKKEEEVKHGLHRWQQGYRLTELICECGHLQSCVFEELAAIAAAHPELGHDALLESHRQLLKLINDTISESAAQYERMQKAEAAGRVGDLTGALASVKEIELRRAMLIHQVVHDLNNDVLGVSMAASRIGKPSIVETERVESANFLQRATDGLATMLGELMELARLEAGQEIRKLAEFDAAQLIIALGEENQPVAEERRLFLQVAGPSPLFVEGDAGRVRRLLQNLLINALKYTEHGGVTLSWGAEKEKWWVMIKDTGPGMVSGPGSNLITGLQEATKSAQESDEKSAAIKGEASHVLSSSANNVAAPPLNPRPIGEGIGLSIVKRLCELLDASLENASSSDEGTTFRVVFPRRYPGSA